VSFRKTRGRSRTRGYTWRAPKVEEGRRLYRCVDHGSPIRLRQTDFGPPSRGGGWGVFAESFLRFNERSLADLDVEARLIPSAPEPSIELVPGGRTGAVPLRSAQTGAVSAGLLVQPRFGWAGVGAVMLETGWAAAPQFLTLPLVPGSARDVPPWVLAGPVLTRLADLLHNLGKTYEYRDKVASHPRGRILWTEYVNASLATGNWHHLPCRYPDLLRDPNLLKTIRWVVERVRSDLLRVGGKDVIAHELARVAKSLLEELQGVLPERPRGNFLERQLRRGQLQDLGFRKGIEALQWISDERGLGGGRELDGLAWQLPLEELWERYVEGVVRKEAAKDGGEVRVGRLGETLVPLQWTVRAFRSLSHLVPDIVVRRGRSNPSC
jgi:hypothetical protein